jgi:acetyl-CoA carboxylase alpha subunit
VGVTEVNEASPMSNALNAKGQRNPQKVYIWKRIKVKRKPEKVVKKDYLENWVEYQNGFNEWLGTDYGRENTAIHRMLSADTPTSFG